jgi:thioredoxin 1
LVARKDIYVNITVKNFPKEVLKCNRPVLVKIGAEWLGTCDIMAPILEELFADYGRQLKFGSIDSDKSKKLVERFGVSKLPTFAFFKNGVMVDQIIGASPKDKFVTIISNLLRAIL